MRTKEEFLREWTTSIHRAPESLDPMEPRARDFSGAPSFYIFIDMDYFLLLSPVSWTPTPYGRAAIDIPKGFVTDFASVPRLFWSLVPPIGRYGYAALFHDFAYWNQTTSRASADGLFRDTMKELGVSYSRSLLMYAAVRSFGFLAWRNNAAAKRAGERRILKEFPTEIQTSWQQWKQRPGVFE